ncbi:hypothetical protein [Hoylesella nanceiensis]|nr:hypothetical protein [Hoylesella nanceiensis]
MAEKNVVIKKKKEGLRIEKKEIFCCVGGAFLVAKGGIEKEKGIK